MNQYLTLRSIGRHQVRSTTCKFRRCCSRGKAQHEASPDFIKRNQLPSESCSAWTRLEEATEIARLRLFLALVASAQTVDQLEPLPNIDFNILSGNSLVGLLQVEAHEFDSRQDDLYRKSYRQVLAEKNRLVSRLTVRRVVPVACDLDLSALKVHIDKQQG
ncbi:MAG: hypothetical protein U5O69_07710 [Candidatus Competibacteraceae bacterium]|nr:hypothetical protein [Candidatus Competibacteraceae bacterium]